MSSRDRKIGGSIASAALLALLAFGHPPARAGESLPDPTRPPAGSLVASPAPAPDANAKLELRAIFHADERRIAVINGRRVETGDRVAGAEVLAIEVDRVRLRRDGETVELELVAPAFKNARRSRPASPAPPAARSAAAAPDVLRGAMR